MNSLIERRFIQVCRNNKNSDINLIREMMLYLDPQLCIEHLVDVGSGEFLSLNDLCEKFHEKIRAQKIRKDTLRYSTWATVLGLLTVGSGMAYQKVRDDLTPKLWKWFERPPAPAPPAGGDGDGDKNQETQDALQQHKKEENLWKLLEPVRKELSDKGLASLVFVILMSLSIYLTNKMFSKGTARRNVSAAAMIREKEGFSTMARMRFTDSLCSHLHTELRNLINVQDIIVHNPGMKALCFVRPSGEIRKTLLEVCKAIHLYSPGYRVVLPSDISEAASYAHAYGGGKSRKRTTRRRSSSSSSSSRSLKRKLK